MRRMFAGFAPLLISAALLCSPPAFGRTVGKIVGFRAGVSLDAQEQMLRDAGFTIKRRLPSINAVAVTMETKILEGKGGVDRAAMALTRNPDVKLVEDDIKVSISGKVSALTRLKCFVQSKIGSLFNRGQQKEPRFALQAQPQRSKLAQLRSWVKEQVSGPELPADGVPWGVKCIQADQAWGTKTGAGVNVAVIDTGIMRHPDLLPNLKGGIDCTDAEHPENWDKGHYHGTHVAGTIAANGKIKGVAPNACLYAVKVLDENGSGTISDVIAGIEWSVNNKMQVANMSLGGPEGSTFLEQAVTKAEQAGLCIMAAAGNDYHSSVSFPARYPACHAISACDANKKLTSFSNIGPEVGNIAPGANILSCYNADSYKTANGTSMATPHAAGVAALILEGNTKMTPADVRAKMRSSAEDIGLPQEHQGAGLINAAAAVGVGDPLRR